MAPHAENAIISDRLLDPTHAEVDLQLHFFSKSKDNIRFSLVKTDNEWRISKGKLLKNPDTVAIQADDDDLLNSPQIKALLIKTMGGDYDKFLDSAQYAEDTKKHGTQRFSYGGVTGLRAYQEFFIFVDLATKKCVPGYLSGHNLNIYGAHSLSELPPDVSQWLQDLRKRRDDVSQPLEIHFKTASPLVKKIKQPAPSRKRNLNIATWTGTYELPNRPFVGGTLKVKQLAGNKISFQLSAQNGANSCLADGEISVRGDTAVYTDEYGKITFRRRGGLIEVDQDDKEDGRCGMHVTLSGSFEKTDDALPKFDTF